MEAWFSKVRSGLVPVKFIAILPLILLAVCIPLQAQLPTATLLGVVKDTSGASVAGATVTIRNTDIGSIRTVTTENDGAYRVPALTVGHYELKVEHAGFKTDTQSGLLLEVSQEVVANFILQVGTSQQEIVVTAEAPIVNATASSLGGLVNEERMADLPLNGRNYIDLSLMQPGITQNMFKTGSTWFSSNGAPIRSNNITLDGALMNTQLGGAATSTTGNTLGVDGIKEYKVITNSFSAEYGQTMGSQMVIVSKGGSNQWTGDAFEYLRNSALDAKNFFDRPIQANNFRRLPELQRNNFGGAVGGPIKKDKTFFFAVFEGLKLNLGVTTVDAVPPAACHTTTNIVDNTCITSLASGTTQAVAPVTQALLALYPSPNLPNNQWTYASATNSTDDYGQIRVDQNFSAADSFFARYTINRGRTQSPTAFTQRTTSGESWNQFSTLSENHIFSPALLNTVRFSVSRTNSSAVTNDVVSLTGPQYSFIAGLGMGGLTVTGYTGFPAGAPSTFVIQTVYTLSDDLFYTRGKHGLKFGFLANRYDADTTGQFRLTGTLGFNSLQRFLAGTFLSYVAATPGSNFNKRYVYGTYGFYAQDDWRATSRLTLNLGLRYEFMTTATETNGRGYAYRNILTDTNTTQGPLMRNFTLKNFSPRVGFAYDVFGNGKTAIHSAFGVYYDVGNIGAIFQQNVLGTPAPSPAYQPGTNTNSVTNSTTSPAVLQLPFFWPAGSVGVSPLTNQYNANQPYTLQYNMTIEQQLPRGIGLSVSYVGLRGIHLWTAKEGNPIPPTSIINGQQFWDATRAACQSLVPTCRTNPNLASVFYIPTAGDSWYNGLQVVLNKALARGLEFQSSYTWSKTLDTTQANQGNGDCTWAGNLGGNSVGFDPLYPKYDKGPSCFDVTQNWRFNLLYHFPTIQSNSFVGKLVNGWWIGNIVSVQSGYSFTPVLTTNRSRSGTLTALSQQDRASIVTATIAPGQTGPDGSVNTTTATFVPYNPKTVITGNPQRWFNPYMFSIGQVGFLGNSGRGMLRGPGLRTWDFSLVKDTAFPMLGEKGKIEFRAEFFNILNHANFGMPNNQVFTGGLSDISPYSELASGTTASNPIGTAGQITTTLTTSRQIQLALKVFF